MQENKFLKIENNEAEKQYNRSIKYEFWTAWAVTALGIIGIALGSSEGDDQSQTMSSTLFVSCTIAACMLFKNNHEMKRAGSNSKVFLKKQIRICKAIFSVFVTCVAIVALANIDASSMGFLMALSTMSVAVGPLYFKANTALDYAEEQAQ